MPAEALSKSLKQEHLNLVVATDGSSHGRNAIGLASRIAQRLDTELKVLIAVDEHEGVAYGQNLMKEAKSWTDAVPSELIPRVGYTEDVVDTYLDEHPTDLLIIGAFRDRGAGAGAHIGLTAQRIVQYAPTSVLMVKGMRPTAGNILACIAPDNDVVIDVVARLANALGSHLHLLHVIPPESQARSTVKPVSLDAALAANDERAGFLRNIVAEMEELGLERDLLTIKNGPVVNAIMETTADGHYDVIAVGSQSGPGYFLGSVADAVLRRASQSVLVVRTRP
jgi:nucleotide-binding universal stress UspA family protein